MTIDSFDTTQPFPFTMVDHHHYRHHSPFSSSDHQLGSLGGFTTQTPINAFKSPGEMMGFPFTNAQWKELERQAMIYKYIMASVPVPPHLLLPINSTNPYYYPYKNPSLNVKFTNGDPEPGRCRRTDGKKWRCSRDAAPDQKYCERHMHRGRPRSRKPVEIDANTKKTRRNLAISSPTVTNGGGATASHPYLHNPVFLDKPSCKVGDFDSSVACRSLKWAMKRGETEAEPKPEQQWQTEIGLFSGSSVLNRRETLSLGNLSAGEDEQSKLFGSTTGLLSLGLNSIDEEMGQTSMGLGNQIELNQNHKYCTKPTPGGPLAEVIQLSCVNTKAYQSSSSTAENGDFDQSPKGVLQKTMVSFSDSSGNSSPSLSSCARVKSEIDLLWLSHQA